MSFVLQYDVLLGRVFHSSAKRVLSAQCVLSSVCVCVELWHIIYGVQAGEKAKVSGQ